MEEPKKAEAEEDAKLLARLLKPQVKKTPPKKTP